MKRIVTTAIFSFVVLSLVGCEETKSKEWYESHPKKTIEVYEKCVKSGDDTDNCHNAKWAYRLIQTKKQLGLPTGLEQ